MFLKQNTSFPFFSGRCDSQLSFLDRNGASVLKVTAMAYGLVCIATTFVAKALGSTVLQASLAVFGLVGGPLLGVFTLGMGVRFANQSGAVAGMYCLFYTRELPGVALVNGTISRISTIISIKLLKQSYLFLFPYFTNFHNHFN